MTDSLESNIKAKFLSMRTMTNGFSEVFAFFNVAGFEIRVVGGCVRNLILEQPISDLDLITNASPEQIISILKNQQIKSLTHGIAHGTVVFLFKNIQYEITTLRKDSKCDGRHARVEFIDSFVEDAARRDLTINAMSIDIEGNLYDYFAGVSDLNNKIIRFVGDPFKRIPEDYLRILRFYRFYSYYGKALDKNSRMACTQNAKYIKTLSYERIWQEFSKILIAPNSLETLKTMLADNILQFILGNSIINFDLLERIHQICNENNFDQSAIRNYFCLTYNSDIAHPLILSKKDKSYLMHFNIKFSNSSELEINIDKYLYLYGKELLIEYLILKAANENKKLDINLIILIQGLKIPVFPLQSTDIIARFDVHGEALGKKIKALKAVWLNSNCKLESAELLKEENE